MAPRIIITHRSEDMDRFFKGVRPGYGVDGSCMFIIVSATHMYRSLFGRIPESKLTVVHLRFGRRGPQ